MQFTEKEFDYARHSWGEQYHYTPEEYERSRRKYAFLYRNLLPDKKDAAILEVGCGGGKFLNFLKVNGYSNFFGIDIYDAAIEQCKKAVTPRVATEDVFRHCASNSGRYDLIVCNHVIEHFSRSASAELLSTFFRTLKPGGKVIITTPNAVNPWVGYHYFHDLTHDHLYTAQSLSDTLRAAGFEDVRIHEETPVPHSPLAAVRYLLWKIRRAYLRYMFMIEVTAGFYQDTTIIVSPGIIGVGGKSAT